MPDRLDEVVARVRESGGSTDVHTDAGRAVRVAVLRCIEHALDAYAARIDSLGARLIAEGLTAQQVEELIGKYREVSRG